MKEKKIIIMNGRFIKGGHVYIGAHSKADAVRMLTAYIGYDCGWFNEVNNYFSIGCWGNAMQGIKEERGIWVQEKDAKTPVRVL